MQHSDNCTICLSPIDNHPSHTVEGCGHTFHVDCIMRWYRSGHETCPNCRSDSYVSIGYTDALDRAKILKRYARRKGASKELLAMVRKVRKSTERKRKNYRLLREFKNKHKEIIKTLRRLDDRYFRSVDAEASQLYQLGCTHVEGAIVPAILSRGQRRYYDSD